MDDNLKEDSLNAMLVEIARSHADKARLQHDLAKEIFSDRSSSKEGEATLERRIEHG